MRKAKLIAFLVLLLLVAVGFYILTGSYSDGYRAGTVMKISHKGIGIKTYEGQLNLGMTLNNDPGGVAMSNIWNFSVPPSNKETIRKLEEAMLSGERVKVHYEEKIVKLPWRGDTRYMVTDVE